MRALFLTPRLPYPPIGGDRITAFHHVKLVASEAQRIYVLTLIEDREEQDFARKLESQFKNVTVRTVYLPKWRSYLSALRGLMFSHLPLQVCYYRCKKFVLELQRLLTAESFDCYYIQLIRMAQYAGCLPKGVKALGLIDCLSLRYEGSAPYARGAARWIEAIERRRVVAYEVRATETVDVSFVVARRDREKLRELGARGHIEVIPNGVALDSLKVPEGQGYEARTAAFVGNLRSGPNQDAVGYLVSEIWPRVRESYPDGRLHIVGANPPKWMKGLSGCDGVTVTGPVEDVRPYLWSSAVTVCPIRFGAGIQTKILESLAAGVPVVASPLAFEGLGKGAACGVVVAEGPEATASAIGGLFADAGARNDLSQKGRAFVEKHFNWQDRKDPLLRLLRGEPTQGKEQAGAL